MKLKKGDICLIYDSRLEGEDYEQWLIGIFNGYENGEWAYFDMGRNPKQWVVRIDRYVKIGVL